MEKTWQSQSTKCYVWLSSHVTVSLTILYRVRSETLAVISLPRGINNYMTQTKQNLRQWLSRYALAYDKWFSQRTVICHSQWQHRTKRCGSTQFIFVFTVNVLLLIQIIVIRISSSQTIEDHFRQTGKQASNIWLNNINLLSLFAQNWHQSGFSWD